MLIDGEEFQANGAAPKFSLLEESMPMPLNKAILTCGDIHGPLEACRSLLLRDARVNATELSFPGFGVTNCPFSF
jgi:hypothetical protein